MLGQITVEYLLIFLVSLSLVSISLFSLSNIKEDSEKSIYLIKLRSLANEFYDKVELVCSLGYGSTISFDFNNTLVAEGKVFTFNDQVSDKSTCGFHDHYSFSGGKLIIENFYGDIILRNA